MQKTNLSDDDIRRRTAKRAAKQASAHFSRLNQPTPTRDSKSLYTWGTLAASCFMLAGLMSIYPEITPINIQPVHKNIERLATAPTTAQPTVKSEKQMEIVVHDPSPTPITPVNIRRSAEHSVGLDPLPTGTVKSEPTKPVNKAQTGNLAAEIGRASAPKSLSVRYQALQQRQPDLFAGLTPLIGDATNANSSLLAGPFDTQKAVADFCRSVRLKLTIDCNPTDYTGKPLN